MEIKNNGERYSEYRKWENMKHLPYDYERDGLIKKVVSNKIWNTDNVVLKSLTNVWEISLVWCMKCVDILNNYKNYLYRNR